MKDTLVIYDFVGALNRFQHHLSGLDRVWTLLFPDEKKMWRCLHVTQYEQKFYVADACGDHGTLEVTPYTEVQIIGGMGKASCALEDNATAAGRWSALATSAGRWLKRVEKNWIAANKEVQENYPLNQRFGIVPHSLIRASLADIYRLDKALGKRRVKQFVRLVEEGFFFGDNHAAVSSMTAADYFEYCRLAYTVGKRKDEYVDEAMSGREMYERYADGRHEGLLYIDEHSDQAFADWLDGTHPKKTSGGHPWEIKRGGNTTHISLSVRRPSYSAKKGFKIELQGAAISRMAETVKMFLAIHAASLPISIADPEGVRKRLLAQDNIGIVPRDVSLHRADQHFEKNQDVYDVMHYDGLGRFKSRITPFITWDPLPIFKPRTV